MDASLEVLFAASLASAAGAAVFGSIDLMALCCSTDRITTKSGMLCEPGLRRVRCSSRTNRENHTSRRKVEGGIHVRSMFYLSRTEFGVQHRPEFKNRIISPPVLNAIEAAAPATGEEMIPVIISPVESSERPERGVQDSKEKIVSLLKEHKPRESQFFVFAKLPKGKIEEISQRTDLVDHIWADETCYAHLLDSVETVKASACWRTFGSLVLPVRSRRDNYRARGRALCPLPAALAGLCRFRCPRCGEPRRDRRALFERCDRGDCDRDRDCVSGGGLFRLASIIRACGELSSVWSRSR